MTKELSGLLTRLLATCYYATSHSEFFPNYRAEYFGMVKMRNFSYSKILGIRDMCVLILILDIRSIPYLCFNLTSSFALDI